MIAWCSVVAVVAFHTALPMRSLCHSLRRTCYCCSEPCMNSQISVETIHHFYHSLNTAQCVVPPLAATDGSNHFTEQPFRQSPISARNIATAEAFDVTTFVGRGRNKGGEEECIGYSTDDERKGLPPARLKQDRFYRSYQCQAHIPYQVQTETAT